MKLLQDGATFCCPKCEGTVRTRESRAAIMPGYPDLQLVRRRRICEKCDHRWITVEVDVECFAGLVMDARLGYLRDLRGIIDAILKEEEAEEQARQQRS